MKKSINDIKAQRQTLLSILNVEVEANKKESEAIINLYIIIRGYLPTPESREASNAYIRSQQSLLESLQKRNEDLQARIKKVNAVSLAYLNNIYYNTKAGDAALHNPRVIRRIAYAHGSYAFNEIWHSLREQAKKGAEKKISREVYMGLK